ncbi:MAG: hypothetical protein WC517_01915 [Patescibacteria group bacterium]
MINPEQKLTGGAAKVEEYVGRIQSGESSEEIMKGLPDSFRTAIEAKLNPEKDKEEESEEAVLLAQKARQETKRMAQEDEINSVNRANEVRAELGLPVQPVEQPSIEATDAEILSPDEQKARLVEDIKQKYNDIGLKKRMTLRDEMFMVGQGINPENDEIFQTVDGTIGINYDAHGVAKSQQLNQLLNLLDNGISKGHDFYTAPFEVPADIKAGLASALGTGGGTAYKDGLAVLTSGYKEKIQDNGIKHVFINDVFSDLKGPLQKTYPQYQFHLLSEQKTILEGEAAKADKQQ